MIKPRFARARVQALELMQRAEDESYAHVQSSRGMQSRDKDKRNACLRVRQTQRTDGQEVLFYPYVCTVAWYTLIPPPTILKDYTLS